MRVAKRRRRQGKTDYKARLILLKSERPRIVIRKTNKYFIVQFITSDSSKDKTEVYTNSRELVKYGWPKDWKNSLKSIPAAYLTGILAGKKIQGKGLDTEPILDFGLQAEIKKSRIYAIVKGLVDSGIKINCKEETFPNQERVSGKHMKKDVEKIIDEVKEKIRRKE